MDNNNSADNTTFYQSYIAGPPFDIFKWPDGIALPSPPTQRILSNYFEFFMDIRVPISIALVYASIVHTANHFRKTNKEPLNLSKTKLFKYFVVAHNMGLCIYSAWTCIGMVAAIYQSVHEVTKVSVIGSDSTLATKFLKGEILLGRGFWRSLCDVNEGIWENGLSFYGFLFYLSKFYEVVDTLIILAKGKQSSLLQTYHHTGAMLSMWAGIRFAAPPIWIFVVFNSLIHTIMYLYYTLSTLKIPVPLVVKRSLTTAQISQFIFGGSFAILHLFVYYFNPTTGNYCACLSSPGHMFALLFNVIYLAPLTYLFINFWLESYLKPKSKGKGQTSSI